MRITLVQPYVTTKAVSKEYYNIQSFGLAGELVKRGFEVTILTNNLMRSEVKSLSDRHKRYEEEVSGFKVVYMPTLTDRFTMPVMPTLLIELSRSKPDIVQSAEDFQPSSLFSVLWCRRARVPCVIYQGMYSIGRRFLLLRTAYAKTVDYATYKYADAFICKSNAARIYLMGLGVKEERTHVIPVGFNRSRYVQVEDGIIEEYMGKGFAKIMLSVGRLSPEKGLETSIKAMKEVISKYPDTGYLILGDGPEKSKLERLIEELGLAKNVRIHTGKVLNEEINRIYSGAYLYLIPSNYEIFNMTMLESLACGCPVIAYKEGGMQDVIRQGETGYLVDSGDSSAFTEQILMLIADEEKRNRLSARAQVDMDIYDWSRIAGKFVSVYKELCP